MNIVVSGCSNSCIDPYEMYKDQFGEWPRGEIPHVWPTILGELLTANVTNLSFAGKGNNRIIADVVDHILTNDVDLVILQLTDLARISMWNSNLFPSADYAWETDKHNRHAWIRFSKLQGSINTVYQSQSNLAFLTHRDDGKEIINQVANDVLFVQMLCEQRGIDLIVINWFPAKPLESYSAWDSISKDRWLFHTGSMHNHLMYKGFKPYDPGHFGNDAQQHIADMVEQYVLHGTQYSNTHTAIDPVYDYT